MARNYGPNVNLKGGRPEAKRVIVPPEERKELIEGIRFHLMGVQNWDRFNKMLDSALAALVRGRPWLTVRQYEYSRACAKNYKDARNKAGI